MDPRLELNIHPLVVSGLWYEFVIINPPPSCRHNPPPPTIKVKKGIKTKLNKILYFKMSSFEHF